MLKLLCPSLKWDKKRTNIMHEYADFSEGKLVMTSDKTFASPSTASSFCLGRPSNGWADWKDKERVTHWIPFIENNWSNIYCSHE